MLRIVEEEEEEAVGVVEFPALLQWAWRWGGELVVTVWQAETR